MTKTFEDEDVLKLLTLYEYALSTDATSGMLEGVQDNIGRMWTKMNICWDGLQCQLPRGDEDSE